MNSKTVYEEGGISVHLSDCLSFMKQIPDNCFDAVLTSPPAVISLDSSYRSEIWDFDQRWIPEARRVSKGPVVFTLHPAFLPMLETWPDHIGVWVMPGNPGRSRCYPNQAWNAVCFYDLQEIGYHSNDFWIVSQVEVEGHPGPSPVALFHELVKLVRPHTVFDPFVGSGATLIAARRCGCETAVGCDISEDYCRLAAQRLADEAEIGESRWI